MRWVWARVGLREATGLPLPAASLWLVVDLLSERASTGAGGLDPGGSAGRGHDSPSARESSTILPSRGPCLAKETSWRRLWPRAGSDSPSSWNGPREGRIAAPPRTIASTDARFCVRVLEHERCCVHDGIRPRTQHPSPPRARTQNLASPRATLREPTRPRTRPPVEALSERRSTRSHSDAAAGAGPPTATQPQGRPTHSNAAAGQTHPEQRSRRGRPTHSNAAAGAGPPEETQQKG